MLVGAKRIAAALGSKRAPYVSELARKHGKAFPVRKDERGRWTADEEALRLWAVAQGVLQPERVEDLELLKDKAAATGEARARADAAAPRPKTLDDVFDFDREQGAEIGAEGLEGEIDKARLLAELFSDLVFGFKREQLVDPKMAKTLKDYAYELTRQITALGALKKELTRERIRSGKLLDEESVAALVKAFAVAAEEAMAGLGRAFLDLASDHLAEKAEAAGVDLVLDSDLLTKLFEHKTRAARQRIAERLEEEAGAAAEAQRARIEDEREKRGEKR